MYCHQKFRPHAKPRSRDNNNLIDKEHPMSTKRKRKRFTPEFKAKVVIEALNVESSEAEICRRHNITEEQLSQWKRQFLENVATAFEPNRKQPDAATERIAELEQLVGRLTQAVDIQKKALDWIASNRSEE